MDNMHTVKEKKNFQGGDWNDFYGKLQEEEPPNDPKKMTKKLII